MKKDKKAKVVITKNWPYIVSGNVPLNRDIIWTDDEWNSIEWIPWKEIKDLEEPYALCRCGCSSHKPFCDGSHIKEHFDGTETASTEPYLNQARKIEWPDLVLTDAEDLCAVARFCDCCGGIWHLTRHSDDPDNKKMAIKQACNCPSGRLTTWDKKTWEPYEINFDQSISLVEDPAQWVSGPIRMKWWVDLESESGKIYETRNRVTLCRCGKSKNKPFCDGSHIPTWFKE